MSLARHVADMIDGRLDGLFVRATVTGTSGNLVTVSGPQVAGSFPRLASYTAASGDEVLLARVGAGYIVLGKVLR